MGPGLSSFAVEQGDLTVLSLKFTTQVFSPMIALTHNEILFPHTERAPAMPLTQIPATCGYNMQRNALGFAMYAPYDGCNMIQEVLSEMQ